MDTMLIVSNDAFSVAQDKGVTSFSGTGAQLSENDLSVTSPATPGEVFGFTSLEVVAAPPENFWPVFNEFGLTYLAIMGTLSYPHPVVMSTVLITTEFGGTVLLSTNGDFTYTSPPGFSGTDTFSYVLLDSAWNAGVAQVSITVEADGSAAVAPVVDAAPAEVLPAPVMINAGPEALADFASAGHGQAIAVNVLGNDSDADQDVLFVTMADGNGLVAAQPGVYTDIYGGVLSIEGNGNFSYVPPADFVGTRTFTYVVEDGQGGAAQAEVSFTSTNADAQAQDDHYTTGYGQSINNTVDVRDNDSDADGDALAVVPFALQATAQGGLVSMKADGTFLYTPKFGFHGADTFTYQVSDGLGQAALATVTIDVQAPVGLITGTMGNDVLRGGGADDQIYGSGGRDTLYGGDGNDVLVGGDNGDRMTGGRGADDFVLGQSSTSDYDRITDFSKGDHLVIQGADFGLNAGELLASGYLVKAGAAASGHGRFVYEGASRSLFWDDGQDGTDHVLITTFANKVVLTTSDFEIV